MNKQGDFIWYELMSAEPSKAREFYARVAGLKIDESSDVQGHLDYRMISAPDGFMGGMLALTEEMRQNGARPCWLGYIGVDDVDASVAAVVERGGTVHLPARDLEGVGRIAMVADPQGAVFYLMRGFSEVSSTVFRKSDPGHVAWNELTTTDYQAALKFYTEAIGWEAADAIDIPNGGVYQMFQQQGTVIGGMANRQAESHPPSWLFYIRVNDIQASVEAIPQAGGQIWAGPMEVPGGDVVVIGGDAEGAAFALVGAGPK